MLILSRRPGDAILIDGGIRIVVLASDQRTVRIGIEAPAKIGILREEIAIPVTGTAKSARAGGRRNSEAVPAGATGPTA